MNPQNSVAVQNAINRRASGGQLAPQLASVTPNMPMASGNLPGNIPPSAMTKSSALPPNPKQQSQKFQPTNQQDSLVLALIEQMKNNNKLESEKLKAAQGQSIQTPPPTTPSFNNPVPQNTPNVFGAPSMAVSQQQGSNPLSTGPF